MSLAPLSPDSGLVRWAQLLAPARQLAEIVAGTEFVPAALRGNPDACCAAIMYGDEIGIDPMQALASIHVVDGRPQPSAELVRAMILKAGHSITVHQATDELCKVSGLRRGDPESARVYVTWTIQDARRAGLLNRPNWQRYPRAMLLARATGELGRMAFPDAIKGLGQVAEDEPEALDSWAATAPAPELGAGSVLATQTVRRRRAVRGRPTTDVPLPESVPDAAPEPGAQWAPPEPWEQPPPADPGEPPGARPHAGPQVVPQTAPEPAGEPAGQVVGSPISDQLRKALMVGTSRVGVDPTRDRDMRLALWSALLARRITSANDLSRAEGLTLLRRLNDCETGAVEWDYSVETGAVTLRRIDREPPP